eukprot:3155062-Prymnesium_polylepis.1
MTARSGADCSQSHGPRDFSLALPLAGVTAHARPAQRPPPGGHSPASRAGDTPGVTRCTRRGPRTRSDIMLERALNGA